MRAPGVKTALAVGTDVTPSVGRRGGSKVICIGAPGARVGCFAIIGDERSKTEP